MFAAEEHAREVHGDEALEVVDGVVLEAQRRAGGVGMPTLLKMMSRRPKLVDAAATVSRDVGLRPTRRHSIGAR